MFKLHWFSIFIKFLYLSYRTFVLEYLQKVNSVTVDLYTVLEYH